METVPSCLHLPAMEVANYLLTFVSVALTIPKHYTHFEFLNCKDWQWMVVINC